MEEPCVAVVCVSSYPLEKNALGAVALLHPGIDALAKMLGDVVLQADADHRRGGASAAVVAGLYQETDADIGLSPEKRPESAQDPSHSQGVVPSLPRGNEDDGNLPDPAMVVKIQIFIVMFFLDFVCQLKAVSGWPNYICVIAVC